MFKRFTILCCMAVLALGMAVPASAAEETGSMRIVLDAGELPVTTGSVTLYPVGVAAEGGFQLRTEYGGGFVRQSDAITEELANWLVELSEDAQGITQELDVNGCAEFYGLSDGLYLLVQSERMEGFYPFPPLLITLPLDTERNIQIYPTVAPIVAQNPATGQGAGLFAGLLCMVLSGFGLVLCWTAYKKRWI